MLEVNRVRRGESVSAGWGPCDGAGASASVLGAGATLFPSSPDAVSLILCLRGTMQVRFREGRIDLDGRSWLMLPRDWPPSRIAQMNGWGVAVCAAPLERNGTLKELQSSVKRGRIPLAILRNLRTIHALLAERTRESVRLANAIVESGIEQLLQTAVESGELARCPGRTLTRKAHVFGRISRSRLFIEANIDRVVRMPELAALSCFSPWHFTRIFSHVFGLGPQEYGIEIRLRRAWRLLQSTTLSTREIAEACGFETNSAFCRAFLNRFHKTPSATRCVEIPSASRCVEIPSTLGSAPQDSPERVAA